MKKNLFIASVAIEISGIAAIGCGIGIELTLGADYGYLCITIGALFVAAGGLLFAKFARRMK